MELRGGQIRYWRQFGPFLAAASFFYIVHLILASHVLPPARAPSELGTAYGGDSTQSAHPKELLNSRTLNEQQCIKAFPGLTRDINLTADLGPFKLQPTGSLGPIEVRLRGGRLYILNSRQRESISPELLDSQFATLHQLHRAVLTSPSPLPDTIFAINIHDQPYGTAWSYSRPSYAAPTANAPPINRAFLMPHFSFWAWPPPFIGSFARAAAGVDVIEANTPFSGKDPRAVWRGTTHFAGSHNPHLRQNLLDATRDAEWADVQALTWEAGQDPGDAKTNASNAIMIEEFCKYKYVIHTEGVTYSGRLQFLQMCNSVLLTPPIAWLQHTTHLIRPVFSGDLHLSKGLGNPWEPSPGVQEAWPIHYRPDQANAVFVAPDWSDLGDTVRWLEEHPQIAAGIASRQRELFVHRGIHGPAAEACYWRALVRGWSKVVQIDDEDWKDADEIEWELFSIAHKLRAKKPKHGG